MESPSMLTAVIIVIILFIFLCAIIYIVEIYNGLVRVKHIVGKRWVNIDVLLKQRHDDLPKLVETCQRHMQYETETLKKLIEARNTAAMAYQNTDITRLEPVEIQLRSHLNRLLALAENYPDLKTNQTWLHLHTRISQLETGIADRRTFYNESVNIYDIRRLQFPDILFSSMLKFEPAVLLEFSGGERRCHAAIAFPMIGCIRNAGNHTGLPYRPMPCPSRFSEEFSGTKHAATRPPDEHVHNNPLDFSVIHSWAIQKSIQTEQATFARRMAAMRARLSASPIAGPTK